MNATCNFNLNTKIRAKIHLIKTRRQKPKHSSFNHKANIEHAIEREGDKEYKYVLMTLDRKEKFKFKIMTVKEAFRRNKEIRNVGFVWARIDSGATLASIRCAK